MKFERSKKFVKNYQLLEDTKSGLHRLGETVNYQKDDVIQLWNLQSTKNLVLKDLPFDQRQVVECYFGLEDGYHRSQRDTAKALNMPQLEVRRNLRKSLKYLSPRLQFIEALACKGSLDSSEKEQLLDFLDIDPDLDFY